MPKLAYSSFLPIISNTLLVIILVGLSSKALAQCTTKISTFPYIETFETTNGNWVPGGTGSDWAWGSPSKQVISNAGGGAKCWIVGGLIGNKYNDGQASWLQSPCFDFTNIPYPYIQFKVFWEIERRFDGAGFQYSIDNGATWQNVGSVNDVADCSNKNWFNFSPVTYLAGLSSVRDGWSGNIQNTVGSCQGGGGSNGWVSAQHVMAYLGGRPSVLFRFIFGAGTTCNSYDGFAIDDINISNAPEYQADYSMQCINTTSVQFTNTSQNCPTNFSWNFGDPATGMNNLSTLENPTHNFSAPGNYTVSLTTTGASSALSTIYKTVSIGVVQATATVVSGIKCNGGSDGIITANVTGSNGPFTYSWNTNPVQTNQTIANLPGGNYTVTVSSLNTCDVTASVDLVEPTPMKHTVPINTPATCGGNNGMAFVQETGGTPPYTYSWSPMGGSASSATGLVAGNYIVTVTDSNQCQDTVHISIGSVAGFPMAIYKTDVSCFGGNDGSASAIPLTGTSAYTYSWSPVGGTNETATGLAAGKYFVAVTNFAGCVKLDSVIIGQPQLLQSTIAKTNTTCAYNNGEATVNVSGGTMPYKYVWSPGNANAATIQNLSAGKYFVTITDSLGCVKRDSVTIDASTSPKIQSIQHTNILCNGNKNGTANVNVTGGSIPYLYVWNNGAQTFNTSSIQNLGAGTYALKVTDTKGCSDTGSVQIIEPDILKGTLHQTFSLCNQLVDSATIIPIGGVAPYTYQWITGSRAQSIYNLTPGFYHVTVTDANGCKYTHPFSVVTKNIHPFLGNDTIICLGEKLILQPGNFATYRWQDGSTLNNFEVKATGTYWVKVVDSIGCTGSDTIKVQVNCQDILFPSGFTPNGDGRNDAFGPLGTLGAVSQYSLQIFNRWGQVIFSSTDPFKKWDGIVNGMEAASGTFIYLCSYSFNRQPVRTQKGTVVLIK